MNLIFLGPPGVGKGTLAGMAQERLGLVKISTGDILRSHIRKGDALGKLAQRYIEDGEFVPDSVIIDMVKDRLQEDDVKNGFILDGFPRTLVQANALSQAVNIDMVIDLELESELIIKRLSGRRVCVSCGGTFHLSLLADEKVCPTCWNALEQRKDDMPETIAHRLEVYEEQTAPLIEYYREKGNLVEVKVDGSIEENFSKLLGVLGINE